jgi:hypothetical protein
LYGEVVGKEKYCVEASNRFATLEDLDADMDINIAAENITDNTKISAKES